MKDSVDQFSVAAQNQPVDGSGGFVKLCVVFVIPVAVACAHELRRHIFFADGEIG